MESTTTYCVRRCRRNGSETLIVRNLGSLAEAAEAALRLTRLQEWELGGDDEFCAEVE